MVPRAQFRRIAIEYRSALLEKREPTKSKWYGRQRIIQSTSECVPEPECAHASRKLRKCSAATTQIQLFWFSLLCAGNDGDSLPHTQQTASQTHSVHGIYDERALGPAFVSHTHAGLFRYDSRTRCVS